MARILYFQPGNDVVDEQSENLATWLLERWPVGSVRPRGLKLYKNEVHEDNDITHAWVNDPSVVLDCDANYIVVEFPKGPVTPFIPYIIAAIVAVAATLLLAPNAGLSASIKNTRSASSNNSLQGRTNAPRPGERIADIRGYVRAYPDLLMDYKIFVNSTEYEVQFLCLGAGQYQIDDVRDGITPAVNISGEQLSFYKGGSAPGFGSPYMNIGGAINLSTFQIMTAKSSNEADGSEVKPPNYADVSKALFKIYSTGEIDTTISSGSTSTVIDWTERASTGQVRLSGFYSFTPNALPAGTYTRNDLSGLYNVVSSGDNILILNTAGHPGWGALSGAGQDAYLQAYLRTDGFWQFTSGSGTTLQTFKPIVESTAPYQVGPYLLDRSDRVMINLYSQSGVYKTDGDVYPFTCEFLITLSDPNGIQVDVTHNMSLSGRFDEAVGATLIVNNPFNGPVNVSVRRTSDTDKDFEGTVVDTVKWRDLYAITNVPAQSYGDVTLIHTVTRATNAALKQKERKLNMLATRIYNGVASRNFADVIMSMHTDPYFGRRTIDSIDSTALYTVQNQILAYFGDSRAIEVGYTFDNNSTTYEEALQVICGPVNVMPYQIGSVLNFWPELPQAVSAMQFGHAFKIPETDKRTRSFSPIKDFTGVQVKYFDHDAKSYLYITKGEGTNLNKIDLLACQSAWLADVRAAREYNKMKYQRITHECTALSIGLQAAPGMRVDMIDNTRVKQLEGVVVDVDVDGLTLTLSDPVTFVTGDNYSITLTHRLGTLENIPITAGDDEFTVVMGQQPSEDIYTGWLRDRTAYIIRTDQQRSKLAMLVQSMEPSGRDNNYQVGLTCINYDARYYQDD